MDHSSDTATPPLAADFRAVAEGKPAKKGNKQRKTTPPPFSLRLTFEERAQLEREAGDMPLGAYIRSRLFNTATARALQRLCNN